MSLSNPAHHPYSIEDDERLTRQMNEKFRNSDLGYYIRYHIGSSGCDERILLRIELSPKAEIIKYMDVIKKQKTRCQQRKYKASDERTKNELQGYIDRYNEIIKEHKNTKS
ncbi:hypothetical protein [uncultured Methanolobus sp.]|uniref:hypothetical protein n=1 Tax=uncultured Methanolobus sp. TaxID=218300 RepID=UPI0029C8C0A4|nr:hypothetical protein [uncultured Methanolobus sp.]